MVYFVGAGPGAEDLITVRGQKLLQTADVIIYAGSLVNPELLKQAKNGCEIYDSAYMNLDEIIEVIEAAEEQGKLTVRLHTGDPSIYGAIAEQMVRLDEKKISYKICPGVSSMSGAAAALKLEYTVPELSQSIIISRAEGRTMMPEKEKLSDLARHQTAMVLFLSSGLAKKVQTELLEGGYTPETPVAVVYKATWKEEKIVRTTLKDFVQKMEDEKIEKTALILVGKMLEQNKTVSRLYAKEFTTEYRKGTEK